MRELKVVGLDVDGKHIVCESADTAEKFMCASTTDCGPRSAATGPAASQTQIDVEVTNVLSPKEIQARIRAGASVEQLAAAAGVDTARVSGSPTRCCWSAPAPPSWPPPHTRSSPTAPRC